MKNSRLLIKLLGPIEAEVSGQQFRYGRQQSALLAALAVEAGRVVSSARLINCIWGSLAPNSASATLRSHVYHLRSSPALKMVGSSLLRTEPSGYRLDVDASQLDTAIFEQLVRDGRDALANGALRSISRQLSHALALWRGPAFMGISDRPFAVKEIARLADLLRSARVAKVEACLRLGHDSGIVDECRQLLEEEPGDQRARLLLALSLYRCGRAIEAANACQRGLERLAEKGMDSAELQRLQRRILQGSSELITSTAV